MLINGSNRIKGLYNYENTPEGTIFTEGDIVLHNNTLYTCLITNSTEPNENSEFWDYYLEGVKTVDTFEEFSDPDLQNTLVSLSGLTDFIQNSWSGVNQNGTLKVLDNLEEVEIDTLTSNSSFQLTYKYLLELGDSLPFLPSSNRVYVVRTTGELQTSANEEPSIFVQEIVEYQSSGNFNSWVRSGPNLSTATWKPTKGRSFNAAYINYIDRVLARFNQGKVIYESFMEDVNNGEYKFWKTIPLNSFSTIMFDGEVFKRDRYYKFIFHTVNPVNGLNISISVEVTPEDHDIPEDSSLGYTAGEEVVLRRGVGLGTSLFIDETKVVLKSVRESRTLNI